jgi:hypothetical protein
VDVLLVQALQLWQALLAWSLVTQWLNPEQLLFAKFQLLLLSE